MNDPPRIHRGALLPLGMLLLAWGGLNGGYAWPVEFIANPTLPRARSLGPLLALSFALAALVAAWRRGWRPALSSPTTWLAGYALVGLVGGVVFSPRPGWATYWGLSFLAVVLVVIAFEATPFPRAYLGWALRANWTIAIVIGLLLLAAAFYTEGLAQSLISGDVTRLYRTYDAPVVHALNINSNGAGRFAAVTLVVAASRFMAARSTRAALAWAGLSLPALSVLLLTESRSAFVGLGAALPTLLVARFGLRRSLRVGGIGLLIILVAGGGPVLLSLATRGQTWADVMTFSGRPAVWLETWAAVQWSPVVGFGFQADRFLIDEHVHNALLQALIQTGLLGTVLFVGAWVAAWVQLFRRGLLRQFRDHLPAHRTLLSEAAALLSFFALRSIPESTGAFFGVDLLLLAPIIGYIHATGPSAAKAAVQAPVPRDRPVVLFGSFACAPPGSSRFGGGEDLLGWSIPVHAARHVEAHVLTDATNAGAIEEEQLRRPADHVSFHFVALPRPLAWLRRVQGGVQFYAYVWQVEAFFVASALHDELGFDVYHHVTYANDWMASHTGALLPVPFIRGPGGGAHRVPPHLARGRGARFVWVQRLRTLLQRLLRMDPVFVRSRRRAAKILVCTRESLDAIPARHRAKAELMPVNGMGVDEIPATLPLRTDGGLRVLTVGKLLDLKAVDLAIEAFAPLARDRPDARLEIIGDGPQRPALEARAARLGIAGQVVFAGWRARADVLAAMRHADIFLFPSLRDGGGAVVIEAMAMGLPVVCFDLAGPGMHVIEGCGIRISSHPAVDPVQAFTRALRTLAASPFRRRILGSNAQERVRQNYTWERLADRLQRIYWAAMTSDGSRPPHPAIVRAATPTVSVLGTPISVTNQAEVLDLFDQAVLDRRKGHVCVCSVNNIMSAPRDAELRAAHATAALCVPDGFPLARIARRFGSRQAGRVRGTDLVLAVARRAADRGHSLFLYGGGPGVAEQMARRLEQQHPGLRVVGCHTPPFRPLPPREDPDVLAQINQARPDIVLVGLSTPKQEKWMVRNAPLIEAPLLIGVGAAFDFIAGIKRPAPRWVSDAGLEWLWRFLQEPRRLWRRIVLQGPAFLLLSSLENLQRVARPPSPSTPPADPAPP